MKIFCIIFSVILMNLAYSQDEMVINYDDIKSKIQDSKSENFYPNLLKRFNDFDLTLTNYENALIYYGFSFQEDYLKNRPSEVNLNKLKGSENFEGLAKECLKILEVNPVSLEANNSLGYSLFKLGKPEADWKKYQKRYRDIRKVIALSGNGLSCDTAFKVIYVSDEYNMIYSYFELNSNKRQKMVGLCDYFVNEPSEYYKATEIYFDASRSLLRHEEIINKK